MIEGHVHPHGRASAGYELLISPLTCLQCSTIGSSCRALGLTPVLSLAHRAGLLQLAALCVTSEGVQFVKRVLAWSVVGDIMESEVRQGFVVAPW